MNNRIAVYSLFIIFLVSGFGLQAQDTYRKISYDFGPQPSVNAIIQQLKFWYPVLAETQTDLNLVEVKRSPGGIHYYFQQTLNGYPIHEANLKVNLYKSGRLSSIVGSLERFSTVAAEGFVYDADLLGPILGETASAYSILKESRYLIRGEKAIPIYRITTQSTGKITNYEVLIDARNGKEVKRADMAAYFGRPLSGKDTSGVGRVFFPDPCTTGEVAYGVSFTDNGDQHAPIFDSLMDTVILKNITYENNRFHLRGPYVEILDLAPFPVPPATSPNGEFFFQRDSNSFEDVMVYFHIDSFHRYVERLGFTNLRHNNAPVRADPHGRGNSDNSAFAENGGNPTLTFGDGGVDDAEDADVIIHEFGHYLSFAASPFTLVGNERRGLDEGIGDFFAATYSSQKSSFDKENIYNWDGHNEFWPGRVVNTNRTYPPTSSSIYAYGEIWASSLVQMKEQLSDSVVMSVMLQEMYSNVTNMSLPDAARLFIDADSMLYNGAHVGVISEAFCDRDLLTGMECSIFVAIEPEIVIPAWQLFPNPAAQNWQIQWETPTKAEMRLIDLHGREIARQDIETGVNDITLDLPSGVYFVQLWQGDFPVGTKKLIIQND
ncbi:MAG: T9SS type A sorting domain-containing protein [Bacteroidota bacterium]